MVPEPDRPATLAEALADLQQNLPDVPKDGEAQYGKYSTLSAVTKAVLPRMGKRGLSISGKATMHEGEFVYHYKLRLAGSDEVDEGFWPLPKGTPQQVAAAMTYYRRYIIGSLTGVASEEDDDGETASQAPPPRLKTAHSDPEHQRLQNRRQPGDRAAERGPVPPEDDLWAGQPAGQLNGATKLSDQPGTADEKQLKTIGIQLNTLGIGDRESQLVRIEAIINGPLDGPHKAKDGTTRTRSNLSRREAENVKDELAEAIKAKRQAERAAAQGAS